MVFIIYLFFFFSLQNTKYLIYEINNSDAVQAVLQKWSAERGCRDVLSLWGGGWHFNFEILFVK